MKPCPLRPHLRKEILGFEGTGQQLRTPKLVGVVGFDSGFEVTRDDQIGHDRPRARVERLPLIPGADDLRGRITHDHLARAVPMAHPVVAINHEYRDRRTGQNPVQVFQILGQKRSGGTVRQVHDVSAEDRRCHAPSTAQSLLL
ncbi:hypothetical protein SDC9_207334 [bioreactor metagenome]|uniref:Uncharacterized protein n=1 Tax=bioreactor metagenome TaxID=1076179 RepID=A0A645JJ10_9ZZZZ